MQDQDPTETLEKYEDALLDGPTPVREQNRDLVEHAEGEIVSDHDGGVNHVPAVIVYEALEILVDDLGATPPSQFDVDDARKLVVARSLANCVEDDWNPHYKANE